MIVTQVLFSVSGNTYDELLLKSKNYLSDFFDIPLEEVLKKVNLEIKVKDQTDSLDFESDEEYLADVVAQVTNV